MIDFKKIITDIEKNGNFYAQKVDACNVYFAQDADEETVAVFFADIYNTPEAVWIAENYGLYLTLVLVTESGDDLAQIEFLNLLNKTFNVEE